jgi:hypothetical protein
MTDLINKVDNMVKNDLETMQGIVTKYNAVLHDILPEKNVGYIGYIIDVSVKHINENHNDIDVDWKTWATLLVKKSFEEGSLVNEEDIPPLIDEFLKYMETDYDKWCENKISVSDYERDRGFFYSFYWKKNR